MPRRPRFIRAFRIALLLPLVLSFSCFMLGKAAVPEIASGHDASLPTGTLAVICGQRTSHCARFAELLSKALGGRECFSLMPQEEIARALPAYPSNLSADSFLSEKNLDGPDFSEAHLAVCARVRERVGTDYLLLVWFQSFQLSRVSYDFGPGKGGRTDYYYYIEICGRLIRYPENRAKGFFRYSCTKQLNTIPPPKSGADVLEKMLVDASSAVADRLGKRSEGTAPATD